MKLASRLFLFPLLFLLLFTAVPAVHAQTVCTQTTAGTSIDDVNTPVINCGDPPICYSSEIISPDQVDYYAIDLVAGQVLTIDVDAEKTGSTLDSFLEVLDIDGNSIGVSDDSKDVPPDSANPVSVDPYLVISAPLDSDVTYYIAISAAGTVSSTTGVTATDPSNTGLYNLLLSCSDPSIPPEPINPVQVGDLLGATGSVRVALVSIDPVLGETNTRFPLGPDPIADLDYSYSANTVFVATKGIPGSISTIDPDTGIQSEPFVYDSSAFIALESGETELYAVQFELVDYGTGEIEEYSLVTIDQVTGPASLVGKLDRPIRTLAYHPIEKALYGVASINSASDLIKIHLEPEFSVDTANMIPIADINGQVKLVALDFDHENVLHGVDSLGNLFKINHETGLAEKVVLIDVPVGVAALSSEADSDAVSGLTFVVDECSAVEPIKTICSSSLSSPMSSSSELANYKLSRFHRKRNPLHRAIGMFKFEGKAGEIVHLKAELDGAGETETKEASAWSWLEKLLWRFKPKNRVFVCLRDAIPGVKFRVKAKCELPLEMRDVKLPADGWYYIMVIRPLRHSNQTDYCLTLESENVDSQAWETFQVAYPGDTKRTTTSTTSAEAKTVEVQKTDEKDDEGSSGTGNNAPAEPAVAPTLTTTVEPVSIAPASSAVEPVDEDDSEKVQPVEETTVEKTEEVAPAEKPAAVAVEEPLVKVTPAIPEEPVVAKTEEVAPVEKPAVETAEEPLVKDVPAITEETEVDDTEEMAPVEKPAVETDEEPLVKDAPATTEEPVVAKTEEVAPADTVEDDGSAGDDGSVELDEDDSDEDDSADDVEQPMVKGAPPAI